MCGSGDSGRFSNQPSPAALGRQLPPPGTGGRLAASTGCKAGGVDVCTLSIALDGVVLVVMGFKLQWFANWQHARLAA